jgi:hypothetical protein
LAGVLDLPAAEGQHPGEGVGRLGAGDGIGGVELEALAVRIRVVEAQPEEARDDLAPEPLRRRQPGTERLVLDLRRHVGQAELGGEQGVEALDADSRGGRGDGGDAEPRRQRLEGVVELAAGQRPLAVEPLVFEDVHEARLGDGVLVGSVPAAEASDRGVGGRGEREGAHGEHRGEEAHLVRASARSEPGLRTSGPAYTVDGWQSPIRSSRISPLP